jgi:RhtB (resistance to homoserine/threonine) family protein
MPTDQLPLFIAAGWLLNLTPGPDVLYIVSNALKSGAKAGVVAGLGITTGCFVHIAAAALGVGALMATSAMAFTVLKWLGAAYLLWMGVRMLFARASTTGGVMAAAQAVQTEAASLKRIFVGGFWTNVLNPKVAIFFLAFVPQFITPGTENKALAFVLLGVLFNINAIPVNTGWALAAAWMARRVGVVQRGLHWLDRVAGAMFVGFGIKLALTESPNA